MAVDTIYIVVADDIAVVVDHSGLPGPPGAAPALIFTYIKPGALSVSSGEAKRINEACALTGGVVELIAAPTGADLTGNVQKNGTTIGTFSVAAGQIVGMVTITAGDLIVGDYISYDITQIGSGTPGTRLLIELTATAGL